MNLLNKYRQYFHNIRESYTLPKGDFSTPFKVYLILVLFCANTVMFLKKTFLSRPRPWRFVKRNKAEIALFFLVFTIWYYNCIPNQLFNDPISTVVLDKNDELLGARIASDGQWRFPHNDSVPDKFKKSIICFEDKRFYDHIGVDFLALSRALYSNVSENKVVSGASTLTMQVIRMSRKNPSRTYTEKMGEIFRATRLEWRYSKDKIMAYYASNAPFGGNVVGLDAAAWKYFGRRPDKLSWAESATLAVLPNSPGLIHPGRNRDRLRTKRDKLLRALYEQGEIDSLTYELSILEDLPEKPLRLPDRTPHLTDRIHAENKGKVRAVFHTSIDLHVQERVSDIVNRHSGRLSGNGIHNAAAIVVDVESGEIQSYVGNSFHQKSKASSVDLIKAPRSTGSILKPLLYCAMLQDGQILPETLIPDVPTFYGSYTPKNFYPKYDGAVPANRAIARSLNIPAVRMLSDYGLGNFHHKLQKIGLTTLTQPATHYGLSLVLGGAETTLWDLGRVYSGMARNLKHFRTYHGQYDVDAFQDLSFLKRTNDSLKLHDDSELEAPAIWYTFEAMLDVIRPDEETNWEIFNPGGKIAWKTGTSFGFRDAWAVGCTPKYVVAVWVGNANGDGRPGLTGTTAAAPLMFEIFDALGRTTNWFDRPTHHMKRVEVCATSGHIANSHCQHTKTIEVPKNGLKSSVCPYCEVKFLDEKGEHLVHSDCVSPTDMTRKTYFVLPAIMEYYYKKKHPDYEVLPEYSEACRSSATGIRSQKTMQVIYPKNRAKIFVPVNLDGTRSSTVFEISHRNPSTKVHWHLDEQFVGTTTEFHEMAFSPAPGKHTLTIVDENGETIKRVFEVINDDT